MAWFALGVVRGGVETYRNYLEAKKAPVLATAELLRELAKLGARPNAAPAPDALKPLVERVAKAALAALDEMGATTAASAAVAPAPVASIPAAGSPAGAPLHPAAPSRSEQQLSADVADLKREVKRLQAELDKQSPGHKA